MESNSIRSFSQHLRITPVLIQHNLRVMGVVRLLQPVNLRVLRLLQSVDLRVLRLLPQLSQTTPASQSQSSQSSQTTPSSQSQSISVNLSQSQSSQTTPSS